MMLNARRRRLTVAAIALELPHICVNAGYLDLLICCENAYA